MPSPSIRDTIPSLATAFPMAGGVVGFGSIFGFRSLGADAAFLALAATSWATAWRATRWFRPADGVARVMQAGILAFAQIVACGLVLGWLHLFTFAAMLVCQVAALAIVFVACRTPRATTPRPALYPIAAVAVGITVMVFVVAMGMGHDPVTAYDSLSYHLFFPARWVQDHAVSILPTPFSDEAQAYQPGNGELFFAWLMLPFHGDLLARIGQVPFYIVGACVIFTLARQLGASPDQAAYPSAFFLVAPMIVEQATGANVDLICAVLFAASLVLGIAAVESDARRDWCLWGISLGLFFGSKYLALVYAPVFLVLPFIRGIRWRALWALPGIAALGAPWYIRNWVAAGSPIYPSSLTVGGLTIARGAFSRTALSHSAFHSTSLRVLALSAIHAFGTTLFAIWLPVALVAAIRLIVTKRWWPAGFVLAATLLTAPLCWIGVPDNADARFLLPGAVAATALFALAFTNNRVWNRCVTVAYLVGLAFILKGAEGGLQPDVPWFMVGWLTWAGVIRPAFVLPFAMAAAVAAGAYALMRRTTWRIAGMTAIAVIATVAMADGAEHWCPGTRCEYVEVASPHIRMGKIYAWRWLDTNVAGAHVAYTGDNLPYALSGHHLQNTVSYVNIDRHSDWRFDQYARSFSHRDRAAKGGVRLASASHVLDPLDANEDGSDTPRPRYERIDGDASAWMRNLVRRHIDYVVVFSLNPYEINYVWHNDGGFPIEDAWARAEPNTFRLVFDEPDARIYSVRTP